ncbi:glycosyltransferase family 2 protein [Pelagibacteraceae bacterium]|nr:glycosyltransferase family 2 protein [Pelagibacteraceae bacterium]
MKKLVSIILNCYNGEKYLKEALSSVEAQTYKNWELIFLDNQSQDKSKLILKSFKNKKFKYFKTKKHLSLYSARNLAIKKTKGDFISFIDSDDTWQKKKLENQLKLFKNKNTSVVYGNLFVKKNKKIKKYFNYNLKKGYLYKDLIRNYNIGILTVVIKKKILIKEKKIFNNKYNIIGDFDLFLRLSKKHYFQVVQKPVATYRIHNKNLSLLNRKLEVDEYKDWYKKNKNQLDSEEKKIVLKKITSIEFTSYKFEKNIFKTLKFFIKKKKYLISFKNIVVLICPRFVLKKYMLFA